MGAIGWTQAEDGKTLWKCGGSLIWNNFVLTAAHCVVDSRNVSPDVVRFGDLDIFSTAGDEFAQQIKIEEIIRHTGHRFASHYNDVALLRLERSVQINEAVIPACLWLDEEVWFKRVHATGWGNVGFVGKQSPVLLKMELSPMSHDACSKVYNNTSTRKLSRGLVDHHICAFSPKADTCEGDSGGPLQVKLMHNMRETPFIIGVTSFGLICGTSTPGVYTRVASYHKWIIETMRDRGAAVDENTFNSTNCVHRYATYREFYEGVVVSKEKNGNVELNTFNYMFEWQPSIPWELAKLGWPTGDGSNNCVGVIVDENTVLTLAECVKFDGVAVTQIIHPTVVNISNIYIHPEYKEGSSYNNIAVLKLESLLLFGYGIAPTCIWVEKEWPFGDALVLGFGRKDLVEPLYPKGEIIIDPTYGYLSLTNMLRNSSSCMVGDREMSKVQHGIAQEHVCVGYDSYIVPEMCNLVHGASVEQYMSRNEIEYTFTLALSQFGRDCGFGEHMIATRLASHVEWLKTILIPNSRSSASTVQFLDYDLVENDECEVDSDMPGKCVNIAECLDYWNRIAFDGKMIFCSSKNVICCPTSLLENKNTKHEETDLEHCSSLQRNLMPHDRNGSLVQIGFDIEEWYDFRCMGSIITAQLVLTTASCLGDDVPVVVQLSVNETIVPIESISLHEDYNTTHTYDDIAVIRLIEPLIWNSYLFPICLWTNQSHTPLVMRLNYLDEDAFTFRFMMPQYNTDCQRINPFQLQRSQLCAREPYFTNTCARAGDALQSDGEDGTFYLVGLAQSSDDCDSQQYITLTRVSKQLDWIRQTLNPEYWNFSS
ncbi:uncharacterized protein LOC134213124 isoform X2 [Armigeres subalbatus]